MEENHFDSDMFRKSVRLPEPVNRNDSVEYLPVQMIAPISVYTASLRILVRNAGESLRDACTSSCAKILCQHVFSSADQVILVIKPKFNKVGGKTGNPDHEITVIGRV